jgi:hypothetical protein
MRRGNEMYQHGNIAKKPTPGCLGGKNDLVEKKQPEQRAPAVSGSWCTN